MNIEEFSVFCLNLRDNLKDEEEPLTSSWLGNCLNDFKLEQKYIASSIEVLPTLLCP
jgi:hypothetical protein